MSINIPSDLIVRNFDVLYVRLDCAIPSYAYGDGFEVSQFGTEENRGPLYITVEAALEWCRKELPHDPTQEAAIATLERIQRGENCVIR